MSFRLRHLTMVVFSALATCAFLNPAIAAETYKVDTGHSFLNFSVSHLGFGTAMGRFNEFEGTITRGDSASDYKIDFTINAGSVDTNSERRDKHLRNADFLNAQQFDKITFESTKVTKNGDMLTVVGNLTMVGVTKPVTIELKNMGEGKDPWNNYRVGYYGKATVKRSEFNINYGLDNGVLGDEVTLTISLEAVRK